MTACCTYPCNFVITKNHALLNTGALQSAMSESEQRRILTAQPSDLPDEVPAPEYKIQIANGNIVPIRKQIQLPFSLAGKIFEETFTVLSTMGNILIGMFLFSKNTRDSGPQEQPCSHSGFVTTTQATPWET